MKKHSLSLTLLTFALLTLLMGCSGDGSQVSPKKVAKITIYEDGTYKLADGNGKPGEPCTPPTKKGTPPPCAGDEQLFLTVKRSLVGMEKMTKTEAGGSVCYITYDSGGAPIQVCWPPL